MQRYYKFSYYASFYYEKTYYKENFNIWECKSPRCVGTEGDKEFILIYEVQPVLDTVAYILLFGIAFWEDWRNLV